MFTFILIVLLLVGLSGLIVKYAAQRYVEQAGEYQRQYFHLDWREYAAALVLMCVVITPITYKIGDSLSVAEQLRYQEFYNGVETTALENVTTCTKGQSSRSSASSGRSNCNYSYDCGNYTYYTQESRQVYAGTDSDGNAQYRTEYYEESHQADIYCPYLTKEYRYEILDSLPGGSHTLPQVYGATEPVAWGDRDVPGDIPLGPPEEWVKSKERLDIGDPRPVTRMYTYDNFILATQEDAYLPFSADIDQYREEGILPDHTENILDDPTYGPLDSLANKLSFVGMEPPGGEERWQEALNGLNAALGMTLRGDVHMAIIDESKVTSQVKYVNALKAYWLGPDFGRKAVAKNSIIMAVGVRGDTVQWAEAITGMPYGNEVMLEALSARFAGKDVPLTPEAVIGNPRLRMVGVGDDAEPKLTLAEDPGIIEEIILDDYPFARASMKCEDKEDGEACIGFADLVSKLEPSTSAKLAMGSIVIFISLIFWALAVIFDWFGWLTRPREQQARHQQRLQDRRDYRYQPNGW